jgi:tetratricopeptide (TPR) repeat protein
MAVQLWGTSGGWGDNVAVMDTQRFEHAIALRDAGRVEEALSEFTAISESTPDPEDKASLLGNECTCLTVLGRLREARERLSRALRIAPRTHTLLYLYYEDAGLLTHEGNWAKALRSLEDLLKYFPDLLRMTQHRGLYEQIQILRGSALVALGRYGEARAALEECQTFSLGVSDRHFVLYNLGRSYMNLGEKERAKKVLGEALQSGLQGSDAVSAHFGLGTIHAGEQAYAKAMMEFEWCLAHVEEGQMPKHNICEWLASTARALGMKEDAERYERLADG